MRAIPIDHFLDPEDSIAPGAGGAPGWQRLVAEGRAARKAADGGFWRIGDLALLVERRYRSAAIRRFAEAIGESPGTVRRLRWVAGAYDAGARARFAELSFSHFQAVARLDDRLVWLERARRGDWSVARLVAHATAATRPRADTDAALRRPVETAARHLARLAALDQRALSRAAREGLTDALDDLAAQIEAVRARLAGAGRARAARATPRHPRLRSVPAR